MSTHERIGYIDIAKAIGIISVIIGHMWWYQPEMNLMYSFHMPLFFGLCCHQTHRTAVGTGG